MAFFCRKKFTSEGLDLGPVEQAHRCGCDSHGQGYSPQERSFLPGGNHVVESLLRKRLAGEHRVDVGISLFTTVKFWSIGGAVLDDGGPEPEVGVQTFAGIWGSSRSP